MTMIVVVMAAMLASGDANGAAQSGTLDVAGRWLMPEENSIIEVYDCGDGTPCGRVDWVLDDGENLVTDNHNKDPELQGRPLEGVMIVYGFERAKDGWTGGKIYNPENGKTYGAKMRLEDEGQLLVKGCVGPICRGMTWTEAP